MNKKLKLVLDLDNTLIYTIPIKENDIINTADFPTENFSVIQLPNFIGLVFIRPLLFEFLRYIYNFFEVSIWTAGNTMYCNEIIKIILTKEQLEQTQFILARDNNHYIDIKTNKIYKNINCENEIIKPLEILWEDSEFKKTFNSKNTLLIDNDIAIVNTNPYNSLVIKDFNSSSKNDIVLCCLSNWLEMIKCEDNIQNISKNINKISSNCSKLKDINII